MLTIIRRLIAAFTMIKFRRSQCSGSHFHLLLHCLLTFQFVRARSLLSHCRVNGSRCIENSTSSTKPNRKQAVLYAPNMRFFCLTIDLTTIPSRGRPFHWTTPKSFTSDVTSTVSHWSARRLLSQVEYSGK